MSWVSKEVAMKSEMTTTKHLSERMSQRGIKKALVELALDLGEDAGDKIVLTRRRIDERIDELRHEMKLLQDTGRKGGITVVAAGNAILTTYRTERPSLGRRQENKCLILIKSERFGTPSTAFMRSLVRTTLSPF
jgi:hypothetical protein